MKLIKGVEVSDEAFAFYEKVFERKDRTMKGLSGYRKEIQELIDKELIVLVTTYEVKNGKYYLE